MMKRSSSNAVSLAAVLNTLTKLTTFPALCQLVGIAACLMVAIPVQGGEIPFTKRVISTVANGASSVLATDLDGDGDIDVLSSSVYDNKIAWYENDGSSPPTFAERVITTDLYKPRTVFAADLDGDGDIDVLAPASWGIAWCRNDGGSPPTFSFSAAGFTQDTVMSIFTTDLDGDGDIDVLAALGRDIMIEWFENVGGFQTGFLKRVISSSIDFGISVFAADVDGDGDIDVLSASVFDDKIAWYENDGNLPPTFTQRVITENPDRKGGAQGFANGPQSVFATDLDGDGDIDVLSASANDDKIAWYENDGGSPPTFTNRVISTAAIGANSVFAVDVDGDGDIDVLSASAGDDKIAWYENDGSSPPNFTEWVISTTEDGATSVYAADMDGDGDIDVLSASYIDGKIVWYENTTLCGDGVVQGAEECEGGTNCTNCLCDVDFGSTYPLSIDCVGIPTVSAWGMMIMTLLWLVGLKVKFGWRFTR